MKKMLNNFRIWLANVISPTVKNKLNAESLNENHFIELGFKKKGVYKDTISFSNGKYYIKWNNHPDRNTVEIKWNKSLRYYGIVEYNSELNYIIRTIEKYHKK